MLDLLRDFDEKKRKGKIMESELYRRFNRELSYWYDGNVKKNGFAQAIATALITIGVSRMDIKYYLFSNIVLIAVGIVLAIVGRALWGINITEKQMGIKINKRFGFPDSPERNAKKDDAGRRILRIIVFTPLCATVAIVTGLLVAEINNTMAGYFASGVGVLVVLIDLIVIFCLSRD